MTETIHITTPDVSMNLIQKIAGLPTNGRYKITIEETSKPRTISQNSALHLYCQNAATALNDAGITFKMFFKPDFEVPWSKYVFKDNVWRLVQKALTDKTSTTKPSTKQYPQIYEAVNMKLSEHGVYVPWPSYPR